MLSRPNRPGPARPTTPRRAAASVEFAGVAMVFLLLVLGIIELGRILMVQHLMTNAARQACRVGVIGGPSTATITATATQALASQGVRPTDASVRVNDGMADA